MPLFDYLHWAEYNSFKFPENQLYLCEYLTLKARTWESLAFKQPFHQAILQISVLFMKWVFKKQSVLIFFFILLNLHELQSSWNQPWEKQEQSHTQILHQVMEVRVWVVKQLPSSWSWPLFVAYFVSFFAL